ncbi:periplasmic binding protein [Leptolyngbya sp. Heron Island J]|nr:periplasmic binding protein [Leptolyngbya sp. Heron Island J]
MHHLIKPFLLMVLSFTLVTACYQPNSQTPSSLSENSDTTKACKVVQHALGETCIPANPQRIVILDEFYLLDTLSALDVKLVGYTPCQVCIPSELLSEFVVDVPKLGDMAAPSLEKIVSLKPDLILGLAWQEQFYPRLSEIAPTVMIEEPELNGFIPTLKYLAKILDKNELVDGILADYDRKISAFRQQFGEKLQDKTVSVIGVDATSFYVRKLGDNIYSQVMSDAGVQFSPAYETIKTNGYHPLNTEALTQWDADFLFVVRNYERHTEDFELLTQKPIWSTLDVVKNEQVHPMVLDVWGPITVNQFIDDLYEYFSNNL